jgi:c-di-GMP-related signal transduction protein
MEKTSEILLARQSISNRQGACVGHELLFRGRRTDVAEIDDGFACTTTVVQNLLGAIGVDNVLGEADGFLNCTDEFLNCDLVDILPAERMVLEILETCELNEALARRCSALRRAGFRVALDDVKDLTPEVRAFLPHVDMVKIDWPFMAPGAAARVADACRATGKTLLAEKIETREDFTQALEIGCDLFQGFYFTRPQLVTGRGAMVSSSALFGVLDLVLHEARVDDIERALKSAPSLTVQILRLANNGNRPRAQLSEITSVRQALAMVGTRQLTRWCCLMLYGAGIDGHTDPLVQLVTRRADFMERVVQRLAPEDESLQQEAYLSALLSLAHIPQGIDARCFIKDIAVGPAIREAIVDYGGRLGTLLRVAERVEQGEFPADVELAGLFPDGHAQSLFDGLYL